MKVSLKAARVNAKISQADAAERLGVSQSTLIRWENDGNVPIQAIMKMCDLYACSIDDFSLTDNANFKEGGDGENG